MAITNLLPLTGLTAILANGVCNAQPPTAPAPRSITIHNLSWTYSDMRVSSEEEFEALVRDLPTDRLTVVLSALKSHRAEIEKKEAVLRELLKAKERTLDRGKQK